MSIDGNDDTMAPSPTSSVSSAIRRERDKSARTSPYPQAKIALPPTLRLRNKLQHLESQVRLAIPHLDPLVDRAAFEAAFAGGTGAAESRRVASQSGTTPLERLFDAYVATQYEYRRATAVPVATQLQDALKRIEDFNAAQATTAAAAVHTPQVVIDAPPSFSGEGRERERQGEFRRPYSRASTYYQDERQNTQYKKQPVYSGTVYTGGHNFEFHCRNVLRDMGNLGTMNEGQRSKYFLSSLSKTVQHLAQYGQALDSYLTIDEMVDNIRQLAPNARQSEDRFAAITAARDATRVENFDSFEEYVGNILSLESQYRALEPTEVELANFNTACVNHHRAQATELQEAVGSIEQSWQESGRAVPATMKVKELTASLLTRAQYDARLQRLAKASTNNLRGKGKQREAGASLINRTRQTRPSDKPCNAEADGNECTNEKCQYKHRDSERDRQRQDRQEENKARRERERFERMYPNVARTRGGGITGSGGRTQRDYWCPNGSRCKEQGCTKRHATERRE
jgi:hypothetical protein